MNIRTHTTWRWRSRAAIGAAALAAVLTTVPAASAQVTRGKGHEDCGGGVPSGADSWARKELTRGTTMHLMRFDGGTLFGKVAYGRIEGAKRGDRVWIDSSKDGGRTWKQCGPFDVTKDGNVNTLKAEYPFERNWARVCGDRKKPSYVRQCSSWYREVDNKKQECRKAPCPK